MGVRPSLTSHRSFHSYCNVISADNAVDGLALIEAKVPDLVLSDVMMPGKTHAFEFNAREVLTFIRHGWDTVCGCHSGTAYDKLDTRNSSDGKGWRRGSSRGTGENTFIHRDDSFDLI